MLKSSRLLGGILLVSGTTIGAGMLALPVATGMGGFLPTLVLLVLYWMVMTYTAFLMLEVNLWLGEENNIISMARKTLGKPGELISWVVYLALLYLLTTAYVAGSRPIVTGFIYSLTGYELPDWAGPIPLLGIFGFFVFEGTRYVDYINRMLMTGLVFAFCGMVLVLIPYVDQTLLVYSQSKFLLIGVPTIATSYGFHIIIPTLTSYLDRDIRKLKLSILIGSTIPLVVYILWEVIALGILPLGGDFGIVRGYLDGTNGVQLLLGLLGDNRFGIIAQFFSFFAISTSFLGVSLSLVDFLADGLKVKKTTWGRFLLCTLAFAPPLIIVMSYPRIFLAALEYAGAYCVMVLLALLPALMVWSGRYRQGFQSTFKTPGGKIALILVMITSGVVIAIEVVNNMGLLPYMKV